MSESSESPQPSRQSRIISGVISLALLVAFLGACLWIDHERGDLPALIEATVQATPDIDGTPVALVEAQNTGDITAEDVLIRVEGAGGPDADPVEQVVGFIAPGESAQFTVPLAEGVANSDVEASAVLWIDAR